MPAFKPPKPSHDASTFGLPWSFSIKALPWPDINKLIKSSQLPCYMAVIKLLKQIAQQQIMATSSINKTAAFQVKRCICREAANAIWLEEQVSTTC